MTGQSSTWLLVVVVAARLCCWPGALQGQEFLDVVVSNRFFTGPNSYPTLQVRTRSALSVDAVICEAEGKPIAFFAGKDAANHHEIALKSLPPANRGLYLFHLAGRRADGARQGQYPEEPAEGEYLKVDDCRWVSEQQRIEYLLPKAACVRIRAGLADSAYLREVLPWEPQPAGRHQIPWANATNDAVMAEMIGRPDFQAKVLALSLPANVVVDQSLRTNRFAGDNVRAVAVPAALADVLPAAGLFSNMRKRSRISIADDYKLTLRVEASPGQSIVNLRLDCAEADRARLVNRRFEVMIFVDGQFLTEDELAILPFNYRMSTRGLAPGQHVATLNVLDSDGVPGTVSAVFEAASKTQAAK
jgi:hypothetical protein